MHPPHLTLVLQTVLAHQLQLVVNAFLLEGTTGSVECLGACITREVRFWYVLPIDLI